MFRSALTLSIAVTLCAWVSAQPAATGPTAAEQLKLLKSNRDLLEDLIDHGVKVSKNADVLDRTDECRRAAGTLATALSRAATGPGADADRIAELSDHLGSVWSEGLTPNLREATALIPPSSPQYGRLKDVSKWATDDVKKVEAAIPVEGKLGTSAKVKIAREQLTAIAAQLAAAAPKPDAK